MSYPEAVQIGTSMTVLQAARVVGVSTGVVKLFKFHLRERGLIGCDDRLEMLFVNDLKTIKYKKENDDIPWGSAIGEYVTMFQPMHEVHSITNANKKYFKRVFYGIN